MLRSPARKQVTAPRLRERQARAPMGGLDLASPITDMPPGTARRLDNWVCRTDGVHMRPGYVVDSSISDPVTAFMSYEDELFYATSDGFYLSGVLETGGFLGGDWVADTSRDVAGPHLVAVNGVDPLQHYNGTAWDSPVVEGVDSHDFETVVFHQRRFFFNQADTLNLWYFEPGAFCGAAHKLPMAAQFGKGGSIIALSSITSDGGHGPDDLLAVVTDVGELAIWGGSNPAKEGTWRLVGVYDVGIPRGKHCFQSKGGSLSILTSLGTLSVPEILAAADRKKKLASMSLPVDAGITSPSNMIESSIHKLCLIEDGEYQWVQSETDKWTRWTIPGSTRWHEHCGEVYFGTSSGDVCKLSGHADGAEPIAAYAVTRHHRFGTAARKIFKRFRPSFTRPADYVQTVKMLTNHNEPPATLEAAKTSLSGSPRSDVPRWQAVTGQGVSAAVMLAARSTEQLIWTGMDVHYTLGNTR